MTACGWAPVGQACYQGQRQPVWRRPVLRRRRDGRLPPFADNPLRPVRCPESAASSSGTRGWRHRAGLAGRDDPACRIRPGIAVE